MNSVLDCDTCQDSNEPDDSGACAKCANHYVKRAVREHEAAMTRGYMSRTLRKAEYDRLKASISQGARPGLSSWNHDAGERQPALPPAPPAAVEAAAPPVAEAPGLVDCPHYDEKCSLTGQKCLLADDPLGACSIRRREEAKAEKITIKN